MLSNTDNVIYRLIGGKDLGLLTGSYGCSCSEGNLCQGHGGQAGLGGPIQQKLLEVWWSLDGLSLKLLVCLWGILE